ncbi:hypothetical protein HanPSC8_Chr10g0449671 [Helianthus annuus]|nr:hypothetical protein HanPSC8_Chr10g0449671 [Helianthus annuus]
MTVLAADMREWRMREDVGSHGIGCYEKSTAVAVAFFWITCGCFGTLTNSILLCRLFS